MKTNSYVSINNSSMNQNKKIDYNSIKSGFIEYLKKENATAGKNYNLESSNIIKENKDKFLTYVKENYGEKYENMFKNGVDADNLNYSNGKFLSLDTETDDNVTFADMLNGIDGFDAICDFFSDESSISEFINEIDSDGNGTIDFYETIDALDKLENLQKTTTEKLSQNTTSDTTQTQTVENTNSVQSSGSVSGNSTNVNTVSKSSAKNAIKNAATNQISNKNNDTATTSEPVDVTKMKTEELKEYKTKQQAMVANLNEQYKTAEKENGKAKGDFVKVQTDTNKQVADAQTNLGQKQAQYSQMLSQDGFFATAEGAKLKAASLQNAAGIVKCEKNQTEAYNAKNDAILARDSAKTALSGCEQQEATCEANVSSAQGTLSGLESALASYSGAVDKEGKPIDTSNLQMQVASAKTSLETAKTALTEAQNKKNEAKEKLTQSEEQVTTTEKDYEKATTALEKANAVKQELDAQILANCNEATKQALLEYNDAKEFLDTTKANQQTQINAAQQKIETSQAKMTEISTAMNKATIEASNAEAEINNRTANAENRKQSELFGEDLETSFEYLRTEDGIGYALVMPDGLEDSKNVPVIFFGVGSGETSQGGMQQNYEKYLKSTNFNGIVVLCASDRCYSDDIAANYVNDIMSELSENYDVDGKNMAYVGFSLGSYRVPNFVLNPEFNGEDAQYHFQSVLAIDGAGSAWRGEETYKQLEENGIKSLAFIGSQRTEMINTGLDYVDLNASHGLCDDITFTMDNDGDGNPDVIKWLFEKDYELENVEKNNKYKKNS